MESITDLKASAYDVAVEIERIKEEYKEKLYPLQQRLNRLNEEIEEKEKE